MIKNVDFSDAGKYTCYATNSIGTGNSQEGTLQVSGRKFSKYTCIYCLNL